MIIKVIQVPQIDNFVIITIKIVLFIMKGSILILFLLPVVLSFNLMQVLQLDGYASSIQTTANGSHVCVVNGLTVDIYEAINKKFILQQKINFTSTAVNCQFTSDNKLFINAVNGDYSIYTLNSSDLWESISSGTVSSGSGTILSGTISADSNLIGISKGNIVHIFEYQNDTGLYKTLTPFNITPSQGTIVSLKLNEKYVLAGIEIDGSTSEYYLYKKNGQSFSFIQKMQTHKNAKVNVNDDFMHQLIPLNTGQTAIGALELYQFNETLEEFEDKEVYLSFVGLTRQASMSADKKHIAISSQAGHYVYSGFFEGQLQSIISNSEVASEANAISHDSAYAFFGDTANSVYVYVNCDTGQVYDEVFDETSKQCILCSQGCINCIDMNNCAQCNALEDYGVDINTRKCKVCNGTGQFLNEGYCKRCASYACLECVSLTQCAVCNEAQGYYKDGGSCSLCSSADNMFLIDGKCTECPLAGCRFCDSLSQCRICDQIANYFLQGSVCVECELTGCLSCSNLTACAFCDHRNGYYLEEDQCKYCNSSQNFFIVQGQCKECQIAGCSQCSQYNKCQVCEANYVVDGGQCAVCNLKGCLECSTKDQCKICDSDNNFSLDPNSKKCVRDNNILIPILASVGSVIGIGLVAGLIYYFFFRSKTQDTEPASSQKNLPTTMNLE